MQLKDLQLNARDFHYDVTSHWGTIREWSSQLAYFRFVMRRFL